MAGIFPMLVVPADLALFLSGFALLGPDRHRDRGSPPGGGSARHQAAVPGVRDDDRADLRDRQRLWHRRRRVHRSDGSTSMPARPGSRGSPCGRCCSRWSCRRAPRRALLAALATVSSVPVLVGARDRRPDAPASGPTQAQFFFWFVFPYLLVVGMAYVGCAGGLRAGHRGQARARAGELSAGGEARRGRDGGGLARPASDAGAAGRDQAHPAVARRRRKRRRRIRGGAPALRARGAGDRPAPLAPYGGAVRLRRRRRRRLLLRHGAARRARRRHAGPALRAHAARAGRLTCCARCVTRCPRQSPAAWCTATSSPRTSSSAATARSTTS